MGTPASPEERDESFEESLQREIKEWAERVLEENLVSEEGERGATIKGAVLALSEVRTRTGAVLRHDRLIVLGSSNSKQYGISGEQIAAVNRKYVVSDFFGEMARQTIDLGMAREESRRQELGEGLRRATSELEEEIGGVGEQVKKALTFDEKSGIRDTDAILAPRQEKAMALRQANNSFLGLVEQLE